MKQKFLYLIIYIGAVLLTACHDDISLPSDPNEPCERTVIFYVMAENSLSNALPEDIDELASAAESIPKNVNVIVYLDNENLPVIYKISNEGKGIVESYSNDQDSCDSIVVRNTLQKIIQKYPAHHYSLILSSHGSGWTPAKKAPLKSIGIDNNQNKTNDSGSHLGISALRWVLESFPKFDYIFFDACFMQCVEVAYELRDVCDWIIGSPAEIPGPGAPYDKMASALCNADVKGIIDRYGEAYPSGPYTGILLSAIKCSELDSLAIVTHDYIPSLFADKAQVSTIGFQPYADLSSTYTHYYDMNTTMYNILDAEAYERWQKYFDRAVPLRSFTHTQTWKAFHCIFARIADPEHFGGISMFVPSQANERYGWNKAFQSTSWYKATGWDTTGW